MCRLIRKNEKDCKYLAGNGVTKLKRAASRAQLFSIRRSMFKLLFLFVFGIAAACSSSDEGGSSAGGNSGLENTANVKVTGVTTDPDFATNGKFTVGFLASDANGNPLLAGGQAQKLKALSVAAPGTWVTIRALAPGTVNCDITKIEPSGVPSQTDCLLNGNVSSTQPAGGDKKVALSVVLDDSGSMRGTDPGNLRGAAAGVFLDTVCAPGRGGEDNFFGVFDFGGTASNHTFFALDDILLRDIDDNFNSFSVNPENSYVPCTPTSNISNAKTAITNQLKSNGPSTPLFEAIVEACQDLTFRAPSNFALGMLVLSDGLPNSTVNQLVDATTCIQPNPIINEQTVFRDRILTSTVGLGPASELDASANAEAVRILKDLAIAGNGVYSAATDAAALQPIFDALGTALTSGQNFATFATNPIPPQNALVTGLVVIGDPATGIQSTFTFRVP